MKIISKHPEAINLSSAILKHVGMWDESHPKSQSLHAAISGLLDKAFDEKFAEQQKALRILATPIDDLKDDFPVVLYFSTDAERAEFVEAIREAKPSLKSFRI